MTTRRNNSFTAKVSVDFVAVNDAALRVLPALVRRWLPDGRIVGAGIGEESDPARQAVWVIQDPARRPAGGSVGRFCDRR